MARTRLFLAIDIGDALRSNAEAMQKLLAKTGATVKWVVPASMHLTLLFLGDVDDRDLAEICKLAKKAVAKAETFKLSIAGLGAFPTPRRPKTLWAGLGDGADEVVNLFNLLEVPLSEAGLYRKEDRPFTPHLTLGRVADDEAGELLVPELGKHSGWTAGAVMVEEVLVMASELRRSGPEYTVVGRLPLAG